MKAATKKKSSDPTKASPTVTDPCGEPSGEPHGSMAPPDANCASAYPMAGSVQETAQEIARLAGEVGALQDDVATDNDLIHTQAQNPDEPRSPDGMAAEHRGPDTDPLTSTEEETTKHRGPDVEQSPPPLKIDETRPPRVEDRGHVEDVRHDDVPDEAWPIIRRLRESSPTATSSSWQMARDIYELVNVHKMKQERIAELVGMKQNTVSEHLTAEKAARTVEGSKKPMTDFRQKFGVHKAKQVATNYNQVPKRIQKNKSIADYARDAETMSARQVRRKWSDEDQTETAKRNADNVPSIKSKHDLEGRVTPGCCVKWMTAEIKKGIRYRVLYCDPPYAYTTYDELPVDHSQVSGLATACVNSGKKEALKVTKDVISRAEELLTKDEGDGRGGGVLLMAQAGGQVILPDIIKAVEEAGLDIRFVVNMDTGHSKLANPAHPYGRSSEYLLVIKRKADDIVRCDTAQPDNEYQGTSNIAPHTSIITERQLRVFAAEWQLHRKRRLWRYHEEGMIRMNASKQHSSARTREDYEPGECHLFQKSEAQLVMILSKFCLPGDRIADLFGCFGSCCIAADQLGLDWHYVEADEGNFNRALRRFDAYLKEKQRPADDDKPPGLEATEEMLRRWAFEAKADRMNTREIWKMLKQNQRLKKQVEKLRAK